MKQACILCTFQKECADSTVFLDAINPLLRQIVATLFRDLGVRFEFDNDLFRIDADQKPALEVLRTRLSQTERSDIRVSRERGAALLAALPLDVYAHALDSNWFDEALRSDAFTIFSSPLSIPGLLPYSPMNV